MASILVVDDDPIFCVPFVSFMEKLGHQCRTAHHFSKGVELAGEYYFDIVFLDVVLPDASGLEGISLFMDSHSFPEIIIITGKSDISGAETALENGAWDYLEKPLSYDKLKLTLKRALQFRKNKIETDAREWMKSDAIIGQSIKLKKCLDIAAKAAKTDGNLFITGETGTGKGLMAQAVHFNSSRANDKFIIVDCTNLPDNLVESLLFGHKKGSFTGAVDNSEGLIGQAHGGTLFLDEIGDLPPGGQKSILRVLQDKTFRPIGSKVEQTCDFRIISATNKNLEKMVVNGSFRKDLYYRLVTYHIHIPPLRERLEDIKELTRHYIENICEQMSIQSKDVSQDFIETLMVYNWKGNVRELISVLHSAIANALNESRLNPYHLPVAVRIYCRRKTWEKKQNRNFEEMLPESEADFPTLKDFRYMNESQYLDALVSLSGGKVDRACRLAGISRSGLYHLLEKHEKKLKP